MSYEPEVILGEYDARLHRDHVCVGERYWLRDRITTELCGGQIAQLVRFLDRVHFGTARVLAVADDRVLIEKLA